MRHFLKMKTLMPFMDLYNEQAGILDGDDESEVDLSSYAYQIWKNATTADPSLRKKVEEMPSVVYSSKSIRPTCLNGPPGSWSTCTTSHGATTLWPGWIAKEGA